jgi:hypothetical protein
MPETLCRQDLVEFFLGTKGALKNVTLTAEVHGRGRKWPRINVEHTVAKR